MRRKSSIEPHPPTPSLHPALQSVLENLDVQLEEELTRYRRLRARKPVAPRKRRNLTGAASAKGDWQRSGNVESPAPLPPPTLAAPTSGEPPLPPPSLAIAPSGSDSLTPSETSVSSLAARLSTPATLQPGDQPDSLVSAGFSPAPEEPLESSEQLLRSLAEEETELRQRDQDPGVLASLLTPLGIGSMLLLLLSSVTFGYLLMNPTTLGLIGFGNSTTPAPTGVDGTAPSSTAAVTSPNASVVPSGPNLAEQEFVDLNLDTLSNVQGETPPTASPQAVPPTPAVAQPPVTPVQPTSTASGNLPTGTTPSRVVPETAPATRPTVRVAPVAPTRPANSQTARPAESTRAAERPASRPPERHQAVQAAANPPRNPAPARPATQPVSRPATPSSPAAPQASATRPASSPEFRVVVPYQGDRSLEEARQVVGDAYVRNFPDGARIQLGAFSDSERAAQLQQELRQQGIEAEVYRPSGQ